MHTRRRGSDALVKSRVADAGVEDIDQDSDRKGNRQIYAVKASVTRDGKTAVRNGIWSRRIRIPFSLGKGSLEREAKR